MATGRSRKLTLLAGALCLALLGFAPKQTAARSKPFDFRHYCSLRTDRPFTVRVRRAGNIGRGRMVLLNRRRLDLKFTVQGAGRNLTGRVRLRYLRKKGSRVLLRLTYDGSRNGIKERSTETVDADAFLAANGILTFRYLKGKRFLQMGRSKSGVNKITTDWGTASLLQ